MIKLIIIHSEKKKATGPTYSKQTIFELEKLSQLAPAIMGERAEKIKIEVEFDQYDIDELFYFLQVATNSLLLKIK